MRVYQYKYWWTPGETTIPCIAGDPAGAGLGFQGPSSLSWWEGDLTTAITN